MQCLEAMLVRGIVLKVGVSNVKGRDPGQLEYQCLVLL